jgi:hypothetical protein
MASSPSILNLHTSDNTGLLSQCLDSSVLCLGSRQQRLFLRNGLGLKAPNERLDSVAQITRTMHLRNMQHFAAVLAALCNPPNATLKSEHHESEKNDASKEVFACMKL